MASSRWPAVVAAVLSGLRARPGYRTPGVHAEGVPVYDGWEVALTAESAPTYVVVGWSDPDREGDEAGSAQIVPQTMGLARMQEAGVIRGRVVRQTGEVDPAAARVAAFAVLADVEDVLRSSVMESLVMWAYVSGHRVMVTAEDGVVVTVDYDITYQARI